MPQEGAMPQQWVAYTSQQHPTQHHLPPGQVHGALGPRGTNHGRGGPGSGPHLRRLEVGIAVCPGGQELSV